MTISSPILVRHPAVAGDRLSTAERQCDQHSRDEFWHVEAAPDAVAIPDTAEEVAAVVAICREIDTPVIVELGEAVEAMRTTSLALDATKFIEFGKMLAAQRLSSVA